MNQEKSYYQNPSIQDLKQSLCFRQKEKMKQVKTTKEFKFIVLGLIGVGKTSLVNKYIYDQVPDISPFQIEERYNKIIKLVYMISFNYFKLYMIDLKMIQLIWILWIVEEWY